MGSYAFQKKQMAPVLKQSFVAGLVALAGWGGISFFWHGSDILRPAALGLALAWGISTVSFLILSPLVGFPMKNFFLAWLGGIIARFFALGVLMVAAWRWAPSSQAALLLSYAFGVIASLLMESRAVVRSEALG